MRARRITTWAGAVALLAAAGIPFVAATSTGTEGSGPQDPFLDCAGITATLDRADCLERVTRDVADDVGMTDAIRRLERAAPLDPGIATACHMALHPVGADAGRTMAAADAALPLVRPRSFCHEGYVHGMQVAWLEAVPTDTLVRSGIRSCDASDPVVDWACGHSLGHALAGRAVDDHAAGDAAPMATAMRWCARTYEGAVHLGLDRDSFLTTCAKGALMEVTLRDEREQLGTVDRDACAAVDETLAPWCEAHAWLRADVAREGPADADAQLAACDELARTRLGRESCAAMVARTSPTAGPCDRAAPDLRAPCRASVDLGVADPAGAPVV